MVNFEYVMSGCAHTRITLNDVTKQEILTPLSQIISSCQGRYGHTYTGLYNAYTEERIGKHLNETNIFANPLHADSGGLQVVTRGFKVTPELMHKVYASQAKYSGVAMCFDDIPLKTVGISKIGDTDSRFFDRNLLDDCVRSTCNNIIDQIHYFEKEKSDSKIMLIAHGNQLEDYVRWIELAAEYIPKELHDRISGLSLAGTSSGAGDKQDIERIFAFYKAEAPDNWKQNFHLLGVGAVSRLIPLAATVQSGLLSDIKISYDSTTHSSNLTRGRYLTPDNRLMLTKRNDKVAQFKALECIQQMFPEYQIDPFYYCEIMSNNRESFIEKYGQDRLSEYHQALVYTCMSAILNFTKRLNLISTNRKAFMSQITKKNFYMKGLLDVKNFDDYLYFMKHSVNSMVKSGVVEEKKTTSLDEFF